MLNKFENTIFSINTTKNSNNMTKKYNFTE